RVPGHLWAEALEAGLEPGQLPEGALAEESGDGQEVPVEATILEHGQPAARGQQPLRLRHARRQGLVHDRGQPALDRGERERNVCAVGGGHYHQVDPGPHLVDARYHAGAWVGDARTFPALGIRGDYGGQLEPVHGLDQRRVEDTAGQAESDDPDADGAGAQPEDPSLVGRNVVVRIRMLRGLVTANSTTSATCSGVSIASSSGSPSSQPAPIANAVCTPPGAIVVARTPCSRSSWSRERVKPTCPNFDAL